MPVRCTAERRKRFEKICRQDIADVPPVLFETLCAQRERLEHLQADKGDCVSPLEM